MLFIIALHCELKVFFYRPPTGAGCHWRDQCLDHQQGPDLPLGRLWTEALCPSWGSTTWHEAV